MSRFAKYLLAIAIAAPAWSQSAPDWRFWTTDDGLRESYTMKLAIGAGVVWAKHGDVDTISKLDGYTVKGIPDLGALGPVAAAPDGDLWVLTSTGLRLLHSSRWTDYELPELRAWGLETDADQHWRLRDRSQDPSYAAALYPLGNSRVLLLLPDRILSFDAGTKSSHTVRLASGALSRFSGMYAGTRGHVWVSGRYGIGMVADPRQNRLDMVEYSGPPGFSEFEEVHEGDNGAALAIASSVRGKSVLRFSDGKWTILYTTGTARLRAWGGADDDVWIQEDDAILRLTGSHNKPEDGKLALTGRTLAVTPESGGAFWLATSQGIARYVPPLWRTPPALRDPRLDSVSTGIAEGGAGDMWFLNRNALIRFDGKAAKIYPLPGGLHAPDTLTDTLRVLPDGRLAILPEHASDALIFDSKSERFSVLRHPEGRGLRLFGSGRRGDILIETTDPKDPSSFRLETFDGVRFHIFLDAGPLWNTGDLRTICETASGDVWLGGTSSLGVYHNGVYHAVGKQEGYPQRGAFFIYETSPGHVLIGGRVQLMEFDGQRWTIIRNGMDRVRSVLRARDGTIWTASGNGVHRYLPGRWITNGPEEGLPASVAFRMFQDSRGRIWAGTTRGISLFHPDADTDPPVTLISEDRNAREVTPDGQIQLVFAGVDKFKATPQERLLYSHRIDGGEWSSFTAESSALFRGLRRGAHRFEVRAMDRNGNIDPAGALFAFKVEMPWYQHPGFRFAAAGVGFLFALLLVLQSHRRGRLIRQLRQTRKVEQSRKEVLEMIARREPLDLILGTIARAVEENERCRCQVLLSDRAEHGEDEPAEPGTGECRREYRVVGGNGETIGVIELRYPPPNRAKPGGAGTMGTRPLGDVVEVMVALAAAAIENARLNKELERQAKYDPLTGALNRLYFRQFVDVVLAHNAASHQEAALLCVDVDRFKQLNDSLGHSVGDEVLRELVARVSKFLGPRGAIGRMGGDEFTILIADCVGAESISATTRGIHATLLQPLLAEGVQVSPGVSIGIGVYPADGEDFAALHKNADCALYRAKQLGKNRFEFFSSELKTAAVQVLEVERDLRLALDKGWFELHYQPQYTMEGAVGSAEALIRLRHPQKGLIFPGEFISVAEDCGLIVEIGQWTIREACRQRKEWERSGCRPITIAVNVSARQFARPDFAGLIADTLREYGLPGNAIEIELTESVILTGLEAAVAQMDNLRALGLSIAIDDFGTGYSSLSYLHQLPIDVLKLDRSFVSGIDRDMRRMQLLRSIVDLAHNLGLSTVAEGVERRAEQEYIQMIGCDLAQGYLFSKPLPPYALSALLRTQPVMEPEFELAAV